MVHLNLPLIKNSYLSKEKIVNIHVEISKHMQKLCYTNKTEADNETIFNWDASITTWLTSLNSLVSIRSGGKAKILYCTIKN